MAPCTAISPQTLGSEGGRSSTATLISTRSSGILRLSAGSWSNGSWTDCGVGGTAAPGIAGHPGPGQTGTASATATAPHPVRPAGGPAALSGAGAATQREIPAGPAPRKALRGTRGAGPAATPLPCPLASVPGAPRRRRRGSPRAGRPRRHRRSCSQTGLEEKPPSYRSLDVSSGKNGKKKGV